VHYTTPGNTIYYRLYLNILLRLGNRIVLGVQVQEELNPYNHWDKFFSVSLTFYALYHGYTRKPYSFWCMFLNFYSKVCSPLGGLEFNNLSHIESLRGASFFPKNLKYQ
jgi:hypothetical protein